MLLMFPPCLAVSDDDVKVVQSLNKGDFNKEVELLLAAGWEVHKMSSNFRKTLFGGVISYKAELKRGAAGFAKK